MNLSAQNPIGEKSEEKTFFLTSNYLRKLKGKVGEFVWKRDGTVDLPERKGFTKLVVEADAELAAEIKVLYLRNPVTTVEDAQKLVRIKTLNCTSCGFTVVPKWIEKIPALKEVHLTGNDLRELPSSLMNMPTLKTVYASNNRSLRTISVGRNLNFLSISNCNISSLPHDLFHHRLAVVKVNGNKGELRIERNVYADIPML